MADSGDDRTSEKATVTVASTQAAFEQARQGLVAATEPYTAAMAAANKAFDAGDRVAADAAMIEMRRLAPAYEAAQFAYTTALAAARDALKAAMDEIPLSVKQGVFDADLRHARRQGRAPTDDDGQEH